MAVLALLASCGPSSEPETTSVGQSREPEQLSILLITIDTLRPDRLEPYGARGIETPHVTGLAEQGVVFERAWAVAPITLPAHASILTGWYPPQHQARNNGINIVKEEITTLAEILAADGFRTGGFVAAAVLDRQYGLAQGFEVYDQLRENQELSRWGVVDRPADSVIAATRTWLDQIGSGERFFAWVHLFDPHYPYEPPEPFRGTYRDRPYDGEVAYVDSQIGLLLDHPRIDDRVVIAVVGDHGESLGAHGEPSHGVLVYDSTLRIPWILRIPGGPAGVRFQEPVSQIDVMPTLLGLVGREAAGDLPGRNLVPTLGGTSQLEASGLYAESYQGYSAYGWAPLQSLVRWPWKLIQAPDPELFDLQRDPGETTNVAAEEPARVEEMEVELARYVAEGETAVTPDEETVRKLRSLGYLATGGASAADDRERRNPRDVIGLHYEMMGLFRDSERTPEETIALLERVLEADPGNLMALKELPTALADAGRHDEIGQAVDKVMSETETDAGLRAAVEHLAAGRVDEAEATARRLLEIRSDDSETLTFLASIRLQKGDFAGAEGFLRRALEVEPARADIWNDLGMIVEEQGRPAEARQHYSRAREIDPENWRTAINLGMVDQRQRQWQTATDSFEEALRLAPNEHEIRLLLADLYGGPLGRPDLARAHLESFLRALPGDPRADLVRQRLGQLPGG